MQLRGIHDDTWRRSYPLQFATAPPSRACVASPRRPTCWNGMLLRAIRGLNRARIGGNQVSIDAIFRPLSHCVSCSHRERMQLSANTGRLHPCWWAAQRPACRTSVAYHLSPPRVQQARFNLIPTNLRGAESWDRSPTRDAAGAGRRECNLKPRGAHACDDPIRVLARRIRHTGERGITPSPGWDPSPPEKAVLFVDVPAAEHGARHGTRSPR